MKCNESLLLLFDWLPDLLGSFHPIISQNDFMLDGRTQHYQILIVVFILRCKKELLKLKVICNSLKIHRKEETQNPEIIAILSFPRVRLAIFGSARDNIGKRQHLFPISLFQLCQPSHDLWQKSSLDPNSQVAFVERKL